MEQGRESACRAVLQLVTWLRKPEVDESEDDQQLPRLGFSDEECCVPKYCKNFLCAFAARGEVMSVQ